eukprot:5861106-Amphidinium_carterae.1
MGIWQAEVEHRSSGIGPVINQMRMSEAYLGMHPNMRTNFQVMRDNSASHEALLARGFLAMLKKATEKPHKHAKGVLCKRQAKSVGHLTSSTGTMRSLTSAKGGAPNSCSLICHWHRLRRVWVRR